MDKAQTPYINILAETVRQLHEAYRNQRIEVRIKETEPNGWQCYIEFTEGSAKLGSESFFINPLDEPYRVALLRLMQWAERGWIVRLLATQGGWVVVVETPQAFEMDVPNPRSGSMGLRFNTAPHETPEAAIAAAAQVLR